MFASVASGNVNLLAERPSPATPQEGWRTAVPQPQIHQEIVALELFQNYDSDRSRASRGGTMGTLKVSA
jgi:hypothetical protein